MHSLNFHSPVIFVKDIELSKSFYVEILDQEIEHDFGANIIFESKLSLWRIREGHEISNIAGESRQGNTFELYFETDNIEKEKEKLKANKVRFLHDIKTEPWGQQTIRFFDPDDHLIEIGEAFSVFLRRIYNETCSVEETSERTGVAADTIRGTLNLE